VFEGDSDKPRIGMSVYLKNTESVSCTLHDVFMSLGISVLCNVVVLLLMREASKPVSKSDSFTIQ
jgi:hypothetical protein